MAYDPTKDQIHKEFKVGDDGLLAQIARYNGGPWKLRLSVRLVTKVDGSTRAGKAGGLSLAELKELKKLLPQIEKAFPKE